MQPCRRRRLVVCLALGAGLSDVARAQAPRALSDSAFATLVARFSEPGGYFDTDNLISNEDSYLHPVSTLRQLGVAGGIYLGVGPDQNFSYIAAIRPRAAIIIDIRRDNLLEHLFFKSLFALARNRAEYLSLLFAHQPPADSTGWSAKSIESILGAVIAAPAAPATVSRIRASVIAEVRGSGMALAGADLETIRRIHGTFITEGPALRFTTFGRPPAAGYPDFAQLAGEYDRDGNQSGFLASEDAFRVVKSLSDRNLIIPVVGNFAGPRAFDVVAQWMSANRERLSALYASNVEQYLYRDGSFDVFARNLERLPRDAKSVIIRSCFVCRGGHPHAVNGYYSVQLVQFVDTFAALRAAGRLARYADLVSLGLVLR